MRHNTGKSDWTFTDGMLDAVCVFKLEVEDGRVLYEGEMRSGWMEYEFEIDAVTGAILDWDADWD